MENDSENKLCVGILSPISGEWFKLFKNKIKLAKNSDEATYIIYESNGDPIHIIEKIKENYPKNKLVFILSGDKSNHIDDECIWFCNAIKSTGLALKQTQIFVTNPAIFKFYKEYKNDINISVNLGINRSCDRSCDIYFKGTIWSGMRKDMYNHFNNYFALQNITNCKIIENNNYWPWRLNNYNKPSQSQLETSAFETYKNMLISKLVLCPKGNGNSSMRIVEALACGCIPILIDDFSSPFNVKWDDFCLVFDTKVHDWSYILENCYNLLNNNEKMLNMQKKGFEYFNNIIYGDNKLDGFDNYTDINTVCYGFSNLIITTLLKLQQHN